MKSGAWFGAWSSYWMGGGGELLWGKMVTRYVGCSHSYVIHIWLRSQPHRYKSVW